MVITIAFYNHEGNKISLSLSPNAWISPSSYPKNISAVKKGEPKKVQITERPKDVISQEEKLY